MFWRRRRGADRDVEATAVEISIGGHVTPAHQGVCESPGRRRTSASSCSSSPPRTELIRALDSPRASRRQWAADNLLADAVARNHPLANVITVLTPAARRPRGKNPSAAEGVRLALEQQAAAERVRTGTGISRWRAGSRRHRRAPQALALAADTRTSRRLVATWHSSPDPRATLFSRLRPSRSPPLIDGDPGDGKRAIRNWLEQP